MSSSSLSTSSDGSFLAGAARRAAIPKSRMEIRLKNHFSSRVYNSGSPVEGEVSITTQRDVRFDTVQILLLGLSRSRLEGVSVPQSITHTLLKLAMPIPESTYPIPRILEAGRTYNIPFNFVVPNHLTIGACNHKVDADNVRDQHLCLPPTMGFWEKDDMAPDVAKVEYCVKARVMREAAEDGIGTKIMEATEQIQILPTFAELPPINVGSGDKLYRMSKTKTLRKNILTSKLGRVTVSATQPSAIVLRADGLRASETMARLQLVFDPASADAAPPKITAVSGKISAHTFYSSAPMATQPDLTDTKLFVTDRRGVYSTSVSLPSMPGAQALEGCGTWQQQMRNSARRDSGYSSGDQRTDSDSDDHHQRRRGKKATSRSSPATTTASSSSSSPIFHSTTLDVPIRLPMMEDDHHRGRGKTFIPSFSSCITARVYSLRLSVTLGTGGGPVASGSTTLTLTLPLQIAAEPSAASLIPAEALPDFETAVQEAAADDHLRPRTIAVPAAEFRETSMLPGYIRAT